MGHIYRRNVLKRDRNGPSNPFVVGAATLVAWKHLPDSCKLGWPRKERRTCIASWSPSLSPFCCSRPSESWRVSSGHPSKHRFRTLHHSPAKFSRNICSTGPPPLPLATQNLHSASAARSTSPKKQSWRTAHRASGRLFQLRFTWFQQSPRCGRSCRAWSSQFVAKRNGKSVCRFAASSPLRSFLPLLSLGKRCRGIDNAAFAFLLTT
jgi:hypothetical protein